MLGPLRTLPALALTAAATTLRLLASVNETIAQRLNPPSDSATLSTPVGRAPASSAPAASSTPATPAGGTPPAPPASSATLDEATGPLNIAALAARPAPEVIAAIESLSTTELGDLYIHEAGNRRRRTVLAALESASAPPTSAPDDLPPLDVRVPDELVYSTVGAKRPNG